jgi:hypothetical protein
MLLLPPLLLHTFVCGMTLLSDRAHAERSR